MTVLSFTVHLVVTLSGECQGVNSAISGSGSAEDAGGDEASPAGSKEALHSKEPSVSGLSVLVAMLGAVFFSIHAVTERIPAAAETGRLAP